MSINKKLFSKTASATDTFEPTKHFNTVLYKGTSATQNVGSYINQGAVFNGSNSKIDINATSSTPIDFSNKNFTISAWINGTGFTTDDRTIVSKYSGSNNSTSSFFFDVRDNDQKLRVTEINGTSALGLQSNDAISENTWTHVVYVRTSTTCEFFINGSSSGGSQSRTSNINDGGTTTISIGERQANKRFIGKIDQVRFFERALTSSEVNTLYGETFDSSTKSTTDIFGDRSGVALYQLDGNANDTGGATGYLNEGAIFDGSSSVITLPTGSFTYTTFSITAWIKQTAQDTSDIILENYDYQSSTSRGLIFRVSSGYLKFDGYYDDFNVTTATSSSSISLNTWTHVACVFNPSESGVDRIKLFINGSEVSYSSRAFNSIQYHSTAPTSIGRLTSAVGTEQYYTGHIDELRVYNDALTTTELGHIASNTTASIPTDNLEAYYKFNGTFQDDQQEYDGVGSNVIFRYDGTASNVNFQGATRFTPDWVWIKSRTEGTSNYTGNHFLYDSVRGVLKRIKSNSNDQESTFNNSLDTFNTNGFRVVSAIHVNRSSDDYVAWCWKGGGAPTATNSQSSGAMTANSVSIDGSLQSAYTPSGSPDIYPKKMSINTQAGFSIVLYSTNGNNSARVPHGLSACKTVIIKKTSTSGSWHFMTTAIDGSFDDLILDSDTQKSNSSLTAPNANTFAAESGTTGVDHIAYCFDDTVQSGAYQKFGTFTGNGDADGPIVETGFEVAWLMIKQTSGSGNHWVIKDNIRSTSNPRQERLKANQNIAENTGADVDFLTNGFQIRSASNEVNDNTETYLYWAIAADPSTASTPVVTNAFDVVNYTGNGSTQEILTDTNPDLVLIKGTDTGSSSSGNFVFFDTVRDAGSETDAPHFLASNLTNGEFGNANTGVVSFDEKGFTVTDDANGGGNVNGASGGLYSNGSYTAFLWSAGSHERNLPTINTQGTLDSTVSVNDAAGFSIVKFTSNGAASVVSAGHGLSAEPELVIFKNMDNTSHWMVYVSSVGDNGYLKLDSTDDITSFTPFFDITSTTIGIRQSSLASSGEGCIAYCWYSVSGYSKIGTYSGNNSATTVYTTDNGLSSGSNGFKPRWVMMKRTSAAGNWLIWDSINNPSADNDNNDVIYANKADARSDAGSGRHISFNSNGFTISGDSGDSNANSHTYLYFAIK